MIIGIIIIVTVLSVAGCIKVNHPAIKLLLGMIAVGSSAVLVLIGSYVYVTRYRITDIDSSVSPDGEYEVFFQSVGEPDWPFGYSHARIVLKQGEKTTENFKIDVANDGGILRPENWQVSWEGTCVKITISGEEQDDAFYTLNLEPKE